MGRGFVPQILYPRSNHVFPQVGTRYNVPELPQKGCQAQLLALTYQHMRFEVETLFGRLVQHASHAFALLLKVMGKDDLQIANDVSRRLSAHEPRPLLVVEVFFSGRDAFAILDVAAADVAQHGMVRGVDERKVSHERSAASQLSTRGAQQNDEGRRGLFQGRALHFRRRIQVDVLTKHADRVTRRLAKVSRERQHVFSAELLLQLNHVVEMFGYVARL